MLLGLVLASFVLGGGGFVAAGDDGLKSALSGSSSPHAAPTLRYALLSAIESHGAEGGIGLERHRLCADGCSSMGVAVAITGDTHATAFAMTRGLGVRAVPQCRAFNLPLSFFHPPR